MYEKICRRHRLSGNVKGFNGERLYGAMNMWADTLPNNSFTSCKLLIDVQEHRYHPYRFRSTNRIQKTVSYTVSKARSEKSICSPEVFVEQQKFPLGARNRPSRPGTGKAFRPPGQRAPAGGPAQQTKKGFPERKLDGNPQRLKRRRATLPHPLECSTIAAPGLSYRVRNGTGRLTRAMTTANLTATARKPKESKPACHRWRFGNRLADARQSLPLYRLMTIPTHIAVQDDPAQERRGTNPPQEDRNCCVAVAR